MVDHGADRPSAARRPTYTVQPNLSLHFVSGSRSSRSRLGDRLHAFRVMDVLRFRTFAVPSWIADTLKRRLKSEHHKRTRNHEPELSHRTSPGAQGSQSCSSKDVKFLGAAFASALSDLNGRVESSVWHGQTCLPVAIPHGQAAIVPRYACPCHPKKGPLTKH